MQWGVFFLLLACVPPTFAYHPAVDTAGPLTARIEAPAQITDKPLVISVILVNAAQMPLQGTVQLHLIDGWQAEPAAPVPFLVQANAQLRLRFTVTAAKITFNAYYPVHGFAEFEWQGKQLRAHPILVLEARLPNPPRPVLPAGVQPQPVIPRQTARPFSAFTFPPPGIARMIGTVGGYDVRVWPGSRGLLDATVGFVKGGQALYFRGFNARVLGDTLEDTRSANHLLETLDESVGDRYRMRYRFQSWAGPFDLVSEAGVEKGAFRTRFVIEHAEARPWAHIHLEDLAAGPWSARAIRIYAGPGNVIQDPKAFELAANGHFLATSYVGIDFANGMSILQGVDAFPDHVSVDPDLRSYSLHTAHDQILSFIPTHDVWEAVKSFRELNDPRPASAVSRLAGRFVFDLWRNSYHQSTIALGKAFRYGLTDSLVILHNWQHWGYDYRLPDIYPPNPQWGTFDDFLHLVAVCKKNGVLFAPHDNYIDFYPDSDGFTYDNIAFTADRKPQLAWFNTTQQAQAYHPRADRLLPFVQRNLRLIKAGFAPDAYYIDAWSSEPPYDYYTSDGQFFDRMSTRDVWRQSFSWIREYLGNAPILSEAGMDQYIGYLDGATAAQMRTEGGPQRTDSNVWQVDASDAERIPWVDFAYHDVFAQHGAGYAERYAESQDQRTHGMYSDDYITTEVMTGHPAMVSDEFGRDPVRIYWLLHDLMRGLALQRMDHFEFVGGNLHRQEIQWGNGGEVWVNRGTESWIASGHDLPQYGFIARIPSQDGLIEAAIERRKNVVVEWSRSTSSYYVNARPVIFDPPPHHSPRRGSAGPPDPRSARMNPSNQLIYFGAVTTNGAFRFTQDGKGTLLTPLPLSQRFQVRLRWNDLPWRVPQPHTVEAVDENGTILRQIVFKKSESELRFDCEAGVFAYRIR
jgi:hypothetical protein